MARITRKTQKIFAGNAQSEQITAFGTAKTSNPTYTTDVGEIQTEVYEQGWTPSLMSDLAPYLQDSNALWYATTKQLAYLFQEGIAEWDSATEYSLGSWVKYNKSIYESIANNNINHQVSDINYWQKAEFTYGGLPIGTIFPSLATSTFVPNGSVACDGTEYSGVTFSDLFNNYLVTGKLATCTYTEYQQSINTYGNCAKFAIDTANQKFKVPTIKNKMYQGLNNQAPVAGNGMTLGFTDGTSNYGMWVSGNTENRFLFYKNFYGQSVGQVSASGSYVGDHYKMGITTDATKSGIVANLNNAEQTLNIRYFVVISTGDLNKAEMDWSEYMANLQGKLNTDLNNLPTTSKQAITSYAMPSTAYTNLSWVAGSTYTAPADGYYVVWGTFAEGGFAIYNTTTHLGNSCFNNSGASNSGSASMPVRKGQKVQTYFRGGTISGFRFVYAEGAQ